MASAAALPHGYLPAAMARSNFTVITDAAVERLTLDGLRCTGAVFRRGGKAETIDARREVIVCAGAYNSPQLLMLSGIGPAAQLQSLGIGLVRDLPGVGAEFLQDHVMVAVAYSCTQPITMAGAGEPAELARYRESRTGLLSSNIGEAGGFVRLDPKSSAPELQLIFAPAYLVRHGLDNPAGHGFTCHPGVVMPKSVGAVTLRSADPGRPPRSSTAISWPTMPMCASCSPASGWHAASLPLHLLAPRSRHRAIPRPRSAERRGVARLYPDPGTDHLSSRRHLQDGRRCAFRGGCAPPRSRGCRACA